MTRHGDLDIEEDDSIHKGEMIAQKAAWGLLFLLILASVAGFLGSGPASRVQTDSGTDGFRVEYDRFLHALTPTELTISVPSPDDGSGFVSVGFDAEYFDRMEIEGIVPEPETASASGKKVEYVFRAPPDGSGPVRLFFSLKPKFPGPDKTDVTAGPAESVRINQFVFP